jgi:hypothetical protein
MEQNTQHLSKWLVIIPLENKASLVGNLSSIILHPKTLAFDGTFVLQSFFKANVVFESKASISNLFNKEIYVDLTENKPVVWGIHFLLSLISLLGRKCSNNKNNSSAETFSLSDKSELQAKFHLQSFLTHSPISDIVQSCCVDLLKRSRKDSLNETGLFSLAGK